jgi:hypothetical protein
MPARGTEGTDLGKENPMKRMILAATVVVLVAVPLYAGTWTKVPLTDAMCAEKVKDNPDSHSRQCIINCADSGFGILADGKFLKFDEEGNRKVLALLKESDKKDHIRVTVAGRLDGETITVESVSLD